MLEVVALRHTYDEAEVLHGVDFEVPAGRIVGMVGNNGAGKSTIIKILAGLLPPTGGQARVGGEDPGEPPVRTRIGFLPEDSPLYDEQTPRSYLRFFGSLYGMSRRDVDAAAEVLFEQLRLDEAFWNKRIGDLSKGSARKVAIARALLHDPDVLLLDEPTSGLDPRSRADLDRLILQKRAEGKAIFLSAHDLKQVEELCDDVHVLHEGRIVTSGSLRDLRDRWGTTRFLVRADAAFEGSEPDGPLHVAACASWADAEAAMEAARAAGHVVDVTSELPTLDEILAKAAS